MSISNKDLREFLDVSMAGSQITDLGKYLYTIRCTYCKNACAVSFYEQRKLPFAALAKLGVPLSSHCKRLEKVKEIEDLKSLSGPRRRLLIADEIEIQEGE